VRKNWKEKKLVDLPSNQLFRLCKSCYQSFDVLLSTWPSHRFTKSMEKEVFKCPVPYDMYDLYKLSLSKSMQDRFPTSNALT
jgi:hypothetical protein